jgi:hypothetical protein
VKAWFSRLRAVAFATVATTLVVASALAQVPEEDPIKKILTDPDSIKKKIEKDKTRPPLEVFRSQVAPFDVLPYVKANHWSTLSLDARSNYTDFAGSLQTTPVLMIGLPQEIVYRREARLTKAQNSRLGMQLLLPKIPKEINLELTLADAIRPEEVWPAALRPLEPHQMLVVVLSKEPSDAYAPWNKYQAFYPHGVDKGDLQLVDKSRYFRLVLPMDTDKPPLSPHPLTWTTISHVVWDGLPPDTLNPAQQQAMLDWLHWGGQLVIVGGPGPTFSLLKDSFLSPYLPGEPTGENALLAKADLGPMSQAYPPPSGKLVRELEEEMQAPNGQPDVQLDVNDRYRGPIAINPPSNRPVFLAGLKPKPGSTTIPLDESGARLLGVERRVGRGRVLMLGFSLTDPSIGKWPGVDTFVRRVVLRRPEESLLARTPPSNARNLQARAARYGPLPGPDLSWVRFISRDMGTPLPRPGSEVKKPPAAGVAASVPPKQDVVEPDVDVEYQPPDAAVAEWLDGSWLPRQCRDVLEEASGIKVPGAMFVLKVVLAYVLALVPLNWLVCRYVFGRRELAWVTAPLLALGFAIGVERAAAYDVGYDSACDQINILEAFGEYPRAHVSRFASLFTTGRTRYTVSFPDNPTALALPMDNGRSLRGEDVATSSWRSLPTPALEGFLVQPRSLSMFRAEEMETLDGAISLTTEEGARRVVNESSLRLQDAVLVDAGPSASRKEVYLGTIEPGTSVEVKPVDRPAPAASPADVLRPQKFLKEFRQYFEDRPENRGELRLVAWVPRSAAGPKIEPPVDRSRGFTAVVVHLRFGPPPAPEGRIYNDRRQVLIDRFGSPDDGMPTPRKGRMLSAGSNTFR